MNLFDGLRDKAVAVIAHNMGYTATWIPSDLSATKTAEVLYKDNTENVDQFGQSINFSEFDYRIEFSHLNFIGLKESVDQSNDEVISVSLSTGVKNFYVRRVTKIADGSTSIAYLTIKTT